jgi:hypothetical protein
MVSKFNINFTLILYFISNFAIHCVQNFPQTEINCKELVEKK